MPHQIMPLPFKPPRLVGLSERLLASHYENNYGGAVRRLNAIEQRLDELDWGAAPVFDINGLKREELVAANSAILHEIYFDGLGGSGDAGGDLAAALERDFGSVAAWRAKFMACAKAQAGGSGWTLLTWSERRDRLTIQWAADHTNCLAGGMPILALDMYEHAYHLDFGAKAGAYVDAFMKNIHWERVAARHRRAVAQRDPSTGPASDNKVPTVAPEELRARLDQGEDLVVLDVCLADDLAKRSDMLPGAKLRAPETIADWADELPRDRPVIVYCVYGFQVSGDAVAELRRRGVDATALSGGIAAWHAIGAPTVPLVMSEERIAS
ncbi:superoxide dismutase [Mesorhizobium sp. LSJC268A00]|uniref:Fe-Mn family superoxide dismutase n=1 Tax=unclassified Mesorhizobium TaxID=325217 RepID=UPI0003CED9E5|nr:Fe-Mn family superoxide dismutase [Mesorhizobium sp. L2C054A000]ESW82135.1 superoxide dismutase [Mesorhizobium sp. LSJC285A00]ESW93152.1 superoxide dismutase [Mesorhizobium sp. LSJC269B00]ESX06570.1 superoxide dismutase [Mesorhizobium sp. LSJC268A00]ESX49079.1 superoxide dismutase [Mesorhizobium sp. LSHC426A00]ESX56159.1 superoxide dismutase [Mesorhizobium sp. LSHC424B00]ESX63071.1 superoxide dismutase [Mesorhizobium sp. LSHC422A00]ESZ15988.1 superoxide dismutase [Mesorhizobium sp. L2C085